MHGMLSFQDSDFLAECCVLFLLTKFSFIR